MKKLCIPNFSSKIPEYFPIYDCTLVYTAVKTIVKILFRFDFRNQRVEGEYPMMGYSPPI